MSDSRPSIDPPVAADISAGGIVVARQSTVLTRDHAGVGDTQVDGAPSPWTQLPVSIADDRSHIDREHDPIWFGHANVVLEPGSRVDAPGSYGVPTRVSGHSSVVVQAGKMQSSGSTSTTVARDSITSSPGVQFPEEAGPWSHLLRVVDGHLCFVGNDPVEHSNADPMDRPGGGFLAFTGPDKPFRTRIGDCLAPMTEGLPTDPPATMAPGERPQTAEPGADIDSTTVSRDLLNPSAASTHASGGGRGEYTPQGNSRTWNDEMDRAEDAYDALPADASPAAVRAARRRLDAARAAVDAGNGDYQMEGRSGWTRISFPDGSEGFLTQDGRMMVLDFTRGTAQYSRVSVGSNGSPTAYQAPETRKITLGIVSSRPPRGAIISTPRGTISREQALAVNTEILQLEAIARTRELTPDELARLRQLRAIVTQAQPRLSLGLPGAVDARSLIVQTTPGGQEYINVWGRTIVKRASITGINPRDAAGMIALQSSYRQEAERLQRQIAALEYRLFRAEAGVSPVLR